MSHTFPTTQWTRLAEATLSGGEAARLALETLCRQYWQPVFLVFRARHFDETQAKDATQGFFLHTMETSFFRKADPLRGKFRAFLCSALRRYIIDQFERKAIRRHRNGSSEIPLEEVHSQQLTSPPETLLFDREWALTTLEAALQRLRMEYELAHGPATFAIIRQFLPSLHMEIPDHEAIAQQLHITPGALRVEVHRLRKQFRECLRREIARTVSAPHEIDEELQHIKQVLIHG
jgi:RNA polymerase sigma factor (sigma-70 family)